MAKQKRRRTPALPKRATVWKHGRRHHYLKPPIAEAVCEFHFSPTLPWNVLTPARFFEAVSGEYGGSPTRPNQAPTAAGPIMFRFELGPGTTGPLDRIQFPTKRGDALLTLAPGILGVSVLSPYPGWEAFHARIAKALNLYIEFAQPDGVKRIGLRYINRIIIPEAEIDLPHYFVKPPSTPDNFPQHMTKVSSRIESLYEDGRTKLSYTFTSLDTVAPNDGSGFLIDLDVIREYDPLIACPQLMADVEDLRVRERHAFEALITDHTRNLFNV